MQFKQMFFRHTPAYPGGGSDTLVDEVGPPPPCGKEVTDPPACPAACPLSFFRSSSTTSRELPNGILIAPGWPVQRSSATSAARDRRQFGIDAISLAMMDLTHL